MVGGNSPPAFAPGGFFFGDGGAVKPRAENWLGANHQRRYAR
ncbi:hypothetical protein ABIB82_007708 [Bradyrhizobium sp. i1.8.4]